MRYRQNSVRFDSTGRREWWRALLLGTVIGVSALALQGCLEDDGDDDVDSFWAPSELAETRYGPVRGTLDEDEDMLTWRGIPYAAPPVGDLRFAPPMPPAERSETLVTDTFGTSCVQPASTFGTADSGEDCLYLNVYSPNKEGEYPVMVWIHGGSLETGSGNVYFPARLVNRDVVVVTINYRLGSLGFLAHPLLTQASETDASGNYGLMDQQAALQWVQDNIANFGGNPDNVTIFGESAGGHSVLTHMISPASEGLFDKVIVQSGSYSPEQRTLADAEALGIAFFTDRLGCTTIECLRNLEAEEILAAQTESDLSFVPNTQAGLLPNSIADALATGQYNQVPVIEGTNRDEGRLFIALAELGGSGEEPYVDPTGGLYPLSEYGDDASLARSALFTDSTFACSALQQARALADTVPVYAYEFRDRDAPSIIGPESQYSFDLGAAHAFEIQYVFSSDVDLAASGMTEEQIDLANAMADYWTQFAHTGDPNSESGVGVFWPRFGAEQTLLALEPGNIHQMSSDEFAQEHECQFWNAL